MTPTVFHLLTETDSFSDMHGAALQRWVANVVRFDDARTVVVCARADASWKLPQVEVCRLQELRAYSKLKGRYRLPWNIRRRLLKRVLLRGLERLQPGDVVWVHNRPDYAGAIEERVRAANAKLVLHLHNSLLVTFPEVVTRSFIADRTVFCSNFLAEEALRKWPDLANTSVIHNGADEARFFPNPNSESRSPHCAHAVVLFAGRLVPEKGVHVFLDAMQMLEARGVAVLGRIFGASGFGSRHSTTTYVRRLLRSAPANVEFRGYQPGSALAEEFRRAQIFCCPSIWDEPFGLVNVEAMASGVASVSTRSGGIPEIFAEGGALLVARESAEELACALQKLICDVPFRERLAAEAYDSFQKNFTWRAAHVKYREVLAGL